MSDPALQVRFGAFLRQQRELSGLSQVEVARALHPNGRARDNSYYARLESGLHDPHVSTLVKLAKILGLEPSELMRFADSEPDPCDAASAPCGGLT